MLLLIVRITDGVDFQSSPPPKERCNLLHVVDLFGFSPSFNPHRPRRSGAMRTPERDAGLAHLSSLTAPE